tara:strand:+ start:2562 stop:2681 length:120 start_codon:yes stop_codon:yes gene_type:complete
MSIGERVAGCEESVGIGASMEIWSRASPDLVSGTLYEAV